MVDRSWTLASSRFPPTRYRRGTRPAHAAGESSGLAAGLAPAAGHPMPPRPGSTGNHVPAKRVRSAPPAETMGSIQRTCGVPETPAVTRTARSAPSIANRGASFRRRDGRYPSSAKRQSNKPLSACQKAATFASPKPVRVGTRSPRSRRLEKIAVEHRPGWAPSCLSGNWQPIAYAACVAS